MTTFIIRSIGRMRQKTDVQIINLKRDDFITQQDFEDD